MSATIVNGFDLEIEWQAAPDGFSSGVDFRTWLVANVIQLRADLIRASDGLTRVNAQLLQFGIDLDMARQRIAELESAVNEARTVISQAEDFVSSINGYDNGMTATLSRAWLIAHPETSTRAGA